MMYFYIYFYIFLLILGICFGSFANVIIYRLPLKKSIVSPPSHCWNCKKTLKFLDLIPVFSYLFIFGKCRYCKIKISKRYLFVELLMGLLFLVSAIFLQPLYLIPYLVFIFFLVIISFIDRDTQEIHNILLIILSIVGLFWIALSHFIYPLESRTWYSILISIVSGGLPLIILDFLSLIFLKKDGFGYGDVKLMAVSGLFLTPSMIFISYYVAIISAALFSIYLLFSKKVKKDTYIAFAPFLAFGVIIAFFFTDYFMNFLFFWW